MPVSPARIAAFDILLRVEREAAYSSELLHSSRHAQLSRPDHGLATELVTGVLRWRSWLDNLIARHSAQPLAKLDLEALTALRLAAYQLVFLERVPKSAAVHESVELVKRARKQSAAPFVNAVLRKLSAGNANTPHSISEANTATELAAASSHPPWLVERWMRELGSDAAHQICAYDQRPPATHIRLRDPSVQDELRRAGVELTAGALLTSARRVLSGAITEQAAFREGRVFIQDEASQLVGLLVGKGSKILDCCAAPGGKTRVLAEQNPQARIVALELHPHRARLLRRLVAAPNVEVLNADIRDLPTAEFFDRVLVDVPCSGTGTLARHPEIKWRLELEDLSDLQVRQAAILQSAVKHVAPGGRLVYSTCSLEPEENQAVVEQAISQDASFHLLDCRAELQPLHVQGELAWPDLSSLTSGPYLRTLPGRHPCDGFFAAILEKV